MTPEIRFLLEDMLAYASEAVDTVGELSAEQVLADRLREHAVLRTVQIVGEAAAQIVKRRPDGFPGLELQQAIGLRNILVHGYAKVRLQEVVGIVRKDLPGLIAATRRLLGENI